MERGLGSLAEEDEKPKDDQSETLAALKQALEQLKQGEASPAPRVGRTPWDAAAEITESLFRLLGQWTTPILVIAGLGIGYYFLEEQAQRKDTAYEESLAVLRQERDDAYARISQFNKDMAEVSSQQISNLTEAFESLKAINDESATRQADAFRYQQQAEDAVQARRRAEDELEQAYEELAARQVQLEQSQALLKESQEKLDERVREVERKEGDLTRRGGTIGELQDLLRGLQESSESYVDSVEALSTELRRDEPNDLSLSRLEQEVAVQRESYEALVQAIVDRTIDFKKVFAPIVAFEGWVANREIADDLIGVSQDRFVEFLETNDGFGFDFWGRFVNRTGEYSFWGVIVDGAARMRIVVLELATGADGDTRIVSTQFADAMLPLIAPSVRNGWENVIFTAFFDGARGFEIDSVYLQGPIHAATVKLSELTEQFYRPVGDLVFGETDAIPVLSRSGFDAYLASGELAPDSVSQLRSPGGLDLLFDMLAERRAGADAWRRALAGITDPDLRSAFERVMAQAVEVMQRGGPGETSEPLLAEPDLMGQLAALALMPTLRFRGEVLPAPQDASSEDRERRAVVEAIADGNIDQTVRFRRSSAEPEWRVERPWDRVR